VPHRLAIKQFAIANIAEPNLSTKSQAADYSTESMRATTTEWNCLNSMEVNVAHLHFAVSFATVKFAGFVLSITSFALLMDQTVVDLEAEFQHLSDLFMHQVILKELKGFVTIGEELANFGLA